MRTSISRTLGELGGLLEGKTCGDPSVRITGFAGLTAARDGDLSFIVDQKHLGALDASRAAAFLVPASIEDPGRASIRVDDIHEAVERVKHIFRPPVDLTVGVHPSAIIGVSVQLGRDVVIMANVVIQDGALIGEGVIVYPGVYIGHDAQVGAGSVLHPNVVVREDVRIGKRVIIHAGAVVGADGFGFQAGHLPHRKIAQVGGVVIGDDVEIGANTTIDRAALDDTVIGRGTKLDNLVQVAHNVVVGEDCLLSSQTGIAGSTSIGSNVILGGQVGVGDHVRIGNDCIVAAKSGVTKSTGSGQTLYGNPAGHRIEKQREAVSLRKIPSIWKTLRELVTRVAQIEERLGTGKNGMRDKPGAGQSE